MSLDSALLAEARTQIAKLEMCSNGTTTSYDSDGRGSGFDGSPPRTGHTRAPRPKPGEEMKKILGATEPEFLVLRRRLERATLDSHVRRVIDLAKEEIVSHQQQAKPPGDADPGTIHWYRQIAQSPLGPTEAARRYNISRQYVYVIRARYGT